ncbi:MAG TPA: 3-deoxy-manno-octulosonate cytidylyltransferase [Vicinamibacterales bacterium]|nr:3-deoxy-manno-octulosonate cytidylyltransferase [Vicinamibacterales bacterium]
MPPVAFPDPFQRTSQPPRTVVVIPARFESSRLPGKPLADIAGRPMIEHVYRRAADARGVDGVVVATDDVRVAAAVDAFGGIVRMTSPEHRSGTDRVAEVARDLACDIIVNVQGDEPLIEPETIAQSLAPLVSGAAQMSTLRRAIADPADYTSPHVVKVVVDRHGDALYFSRAPIPSVRNGGRGANPPGSSGEPERLVPLFKHIGLYAYRREFLLEIAALAPTPLEIAESLEQLRVLEHGFRIHTVETEFDSIGVDTPEDLERVRHLHTVASRA